MSEILINEDLLHLKFKSPDQESCFFGYYGLNQFSQDNKRILSHRTNFEGRMPNNEDTAEIGYFDLEEGTWHHLTKTHSFNWQQGAMLQWKPDEPGTILFNDYRNGKYITVIHDIETGTERTVDYPYYNVLGPSNRAVTLDFERIFWTRSYHYFNIEKVEKNRPYIGDDGLYLVDLEKNTQESLISIKQLVAEEEKMDEAYYWLDHPVANPAGDKVFFLLRYGTAVEFNTRAYVIDLNTRELFNHPITEENAQLSHQAWHSDTAYVLYTIPKSKVLQSVGKAEKSKPWIKLALFVYRKFVKPFTPRKMVSKLTAVNQYYEWVDVTTGERKAFDYMTIPLDGHPVFTAEGHYLITDTYQDHENFRHLLILNLKKKQCLTLGKIYSSVNNYGWRADLHPRISSDDNFLAMDSTVNGHHQQLVFELNWPAIEEKFEKND